MKHPSAVRVLVTYGWCRTAYVVAESLAKAGYAVYGCDDSRWNMLSCSRHVRGFDVVSNPFRNPRQFVSDLASVVRKRKIDILLPVHEDVLAVAQFRDLLPKDTVVIAPRHEDLLLAVDKCEIIRVAGRAGVPSPRTFEPRTAQEVAAAARELSGPLILKTRRGNSGKGVIFVKSPAEAGGLWKHLIRRFRLPAGREPLVQEYLEGDLYGSCFLASKGEIKGLFLEKYLRWKDGKFGTSVLREPSSWELLGDYTRQIVRELRWTGIGHLDFTGRQHENRAWLLEMNPRFWGALNMAVQNGYDFPLGLVSMYQRSEPEAVAFSPRMRQRKSVWIVGELIAGLEGTRGGNLAAILSSLGRILLPPSAAGYDDFRWGDPLVLAGEMVQYLSRFWRSGLSMNPVIDEMMQ
jgi:predicted ATP-grasp superfamily ATP-dependent carboligase